MSCVPRKHTVTPSHRHTVFPYRSPLQLFYGKTDISNIQIIAFARFLYAIAQQDVEGACQSVAASPELPSLLFSRSGAAAADSGDGAGKAEAEIGGADGAHNAEESKTAHQEECMVCDRCGRSDFKTIPVLVPAFPRSVSLA